jgi:hypothetical protein
LHVLSVDGAGGDFAAEPTTATLGASRTALARLLLPKTHYPIGALNFDSHPASMSGLGCIANQGAFPGRSANTGYLGIYPQADE